jgi:FkbM family methyltransferase
MTFNSFAQNFEDVILNRALSGIKNGFYIDVGAFDPNFHSVTKAFYLQGWAGINIEPLEHKIKLFDKERPRDINLSYLISDEETTLTFYEDTHGGLSTASEDAFNRAVKLGHAFRLNAKTARKLNSVLEEFVLKDQDIHFLKVDVEGFESKVLNSIDFDIYRPWIVIVESHFPLTQIPTEKAWDNLLINSRYACVYEDGLNQFYLANERSELKMKFKYPPNVFDDFTLEAGFYSNRLCLSSTMDSALQNQLNLISAELAIIKASRSWKVAIKLQALYRLFRLSNQPVFFLKTRVIPFIIKRKIRQFEEIRIEDLVPKEQFLLKYSDGLISRDDWSSETVSEERFKQDNFFKWMNLLKEPPKLHSKQFQQYAIMEAANSIEPTGGRRRLAIGFGVGKEPIPAALVKIGYSVTATDFLDGEISDQWQRTGQLVASPDELNERKIISPKDFSEYLQFRNMDMNQIPTDLQGKFDFVWSSCALGHIGGYEQGLDFIRNSLLLLKPGGIALHSTELDVSKLKGRYESSTLNFYKLEDLNAIIQKASMNGFSVSSIAPVRKKRGASEKFVVREPWAEKPHMRIEIYGREILSVVLRFQRDFR